MKKDTWRMSVFTAVLAAVTGGFCLVQMAESGSGAALAAGIAWLICAAAWVVEAVRRFRKDRRDSEHK